MNNSILLKNERIFSGNLVLINADFSLKQASEDELMPVDTGFADIHIKREAVNMLQFIFKKIGSKDEIMPVSGYRSKAEQTEIYTNSLRENGEEFTKKFVAFPNHSEHQTGLAIDLALKKDNIDFIRPDFPYEGICDKFRKTAPQYGFIERYPSKKENITGIAHEPWHFRYVGYPHSQIISKNDFTLEEYIDYIKQFRGGDRHLRVKSNKKIIEIFYLTANNSGTTKLATSKNSIYQISGNNNDGFIVTAWRDCDE